MLRSSFAGFSGLLVVAALSSGCLGGGDAAVDETGVSTDELSNRAWESIAGAWVASSGTFQGLVITRTPEGQGRHFFADVDTGIRCITTPCPSQAHLEGRVTAGSRNLTLRHPDRPSAESAPFYGTYAYTLSGSTLTLSQGGRVVARLRKATSYCSDADQCAEQGLITPRCVGRFECESNACAYRCGTPAPVTCASVRCAAGTICVEADTGAHCITACATVRCSSGHHCVADASGARCVADAGTCATDADCRLSDNYCGGCACDALGPGQSPATCSSPVMCLRQPCAGMTARCDAATHRCQAAPSTPPAGIRCGTNTCGAGTYCCNPLRSMCARIGVLCIQ
jgi:hypothetical protein